MAKAIMKCFVAAMLLAAAVALPDEMMSYENHQVWKMTPTNQLQLDVLTHIRNDFSVALKLDWWMYPSHIGKYVMVRIPPEAKPVVQRFLTESHLSHTVVIENVQPLVEMQLDAALKTSTHAADFDFSQYHKLDDINTWVQTLPRQFPGLATVFQVGTSYERRPMYAVKISSNKTTADGSAKIGFWMDGGIHAREWIAPATVLYMLNQLLSQYGKDAKITGLVDSLDIFVLPVFNVDGYEYTWTKDRMWRKTRSHNGGVCIGVDPNRNWGFHWGEQGGSSNPCDDAYWGPKAFSEIEVKSVADYIQNQTNINAYFNFHSFAQLWMSPWGYSSALPKDYTAQEELSKTAVAALEAVHGTKYQYGPIYTTIYPASGSSADWTYGVCDVVFSYGVELRDTGEFGFLLPATEIIPSGEETLQGILAAMQYVVAHPRP